MKGYIGTPPGCHPECVISSECSNNRACLNQKCVDPCIDACGTNTVCKVINHSPICNCKHLYTGDPFSRCNPLPRKAIQILQIYFCAYMFVQIYNHYLYFSSGCKRRFGTISKSMRTITLRSKFYMSSYWANTVVHMYAKLPWKSTKL